MVAISNSALSQLKRIKDKIEGARSYFAKNYERFHEYRRFVFESSISDNQRAILREMKRPDEEFNIVEAFISRLLGEFAKHEPSIIVSPSDAQQVDPKIIQVVEGYIRHVLYEANKSSFAYEVYKDVLSGGFSVMKAWPEYSSKMSFDYTLKVGRAFDPTLCGFDPMARAPHKGDGQFCFEIYPLLEKDFKEQFPKAKVDEVDFRRNFEGFNWSYVNDRNEKIILVVDYYEKKKKKTKIVKLANGRVITAKQYEKLAQFWEEQQFIAQIPAVVSERTTEIEIICQYRLNQAEVMEYNETDFSYLPLVFVDGHSVILRQGADNTTYQMTRPYIYHAKGIQNLKNFAGQSLASSLEDIVQHKFIVKKEAIPQEDDYLDALNDIQRANTVVVNAYNDNNPDQPIPEPIREVQKVPAPPEVMSAFSVSDQMTQMILGSFDASLGINDNQLSGVAVIEAATQSNAAAMPYMVGYLQGLTQIANLLVDLIPKYITNKRKLPLVDKKGKSSYQEVNVEELKLDYDQDALKVNIEAGVNYQIQKNQALQQIVALMQASQSFAAFMNSAGLPILIKNLTIHGVDELEILAEQWQKQQEMMQQQQMKMQQQAMMNDPRMITAKAKVMEIQQKGQDQQMKNMIELKQMQAEEAKTNVELIKYSTERKLSEDENLREDKRMAMEHEKHVHEIIMDHASHAHEVTMAHTNAALEHKKLENDRAKAKNNH